MTSNPAKRAYDDAYRYRNQLREVEAERDQLRDQLEQLTRSTIEDVAKSIGLAKPETLWKLGFTAEQVQGIDGVINHDRARRVIRAFADANGLSMNPAATQNTPQEGMESLFEA